MTDSTLPDPLDEAAKHTWSDFLDPLVRRALAARACGEPVRITRNEFVVLIPGTDIDGPFTLFGWPITVEDS